MSAEDTSQSVIFEKLNRKFRRPQPLGGNYVIITVRSERKQKNYSNPFRIHKFLFLSYSFEIETTLPYTPVVPPKTIPDSRPKQAKCIPVFRPKRRKSPQPEPYSMGRTYIAYIRKYPTPAPLGSAHNMQNKNLLLLCLQVKLAWELTMDTNMELC